jgi:hypothetical protein
MQQPLDKFFVLQGPRTEGRRFLCPDLLAAIKKLVSYAKKQKSNIKVVRK